MTLDREELRRLFASLKENAELAETVLSDTRIQGPTVEHEALFRLAAIETRMGQARRLFEAGPSRPSGGHLRALDNPKGAA